MEIQVESPSEPLQKCDGPDLGPHNALTLGARPVTGEHGICEDSHEGTEHVLLEGREPSQFEGEREDELAQGYIRDHAIGKVCGGIRHTTPRATRANSTALARVRNDQIVAAQVATKPRESMRKNPTAQIRPQLGLDVWREGALVGLACMR